MGKREYFPAFFSYKRTLKRLTDEEFGRVFRAALEYAENGTEPDLTDKEMFGFDFIKEDIDRANDKYENLCEVRKANGSKGGRPQSEKPNGFSETNSFAENQMVSEKPNETKKTYSEGKGEGKGKGEGEENSIVVAEAAPTAQKKRFVPPTEDDVKAYCESQGLDVDPVSFVAFYESKGWMVGKNHMKDWQAACRTWARSQRGFGTPRAAPNSKPPVDPLMEYLDKVISGEE